jgi:hypothetical protein
MTKRKLEKPEGDATVTTITDAGEVQGNAAEEQFGVEGNGEEKPKEPKDARFVRLANRRVPKALKAISVIRNLSNRSQYEYTVQQAARIIVVMKHAVEGLERAFSGVKEEETWKL